MIMINFKYITLFSTVGRKMIHDDSGQRRQYTDVLGKRACQYNNLLGMLCVSKCAIFVRYVKATSLHDGFYQVL